MLSKKNIQRYNQNFYSNFSHPFIKTQSFKILNPLHTTFNMSFNVRDISSERETLPVPDSMQAFERNMFTVMHIAELSMKYLHKD